MKKLLLGITMGCPVGIGPEIILRLHRELAEDSEYYPVVLGDPEVLDRCRQELGIEVELVRVAAGRGDYGRSGECSADHQAGPGTALGAADSGHRPGHDRLYRGGGPALP